MSKIVVIIPYLPWPLSSGGNAAVFSTLKCLCDDHDFVLVFPIHNERQEEDAKKLARELPKVRVSAIRVDFKVIAGEIRSADPLWRKGLRSMARAVRKILSPPPSGDAVPAQQGAVTAPYDALYLHGSEFIAGLGQVIAGGADIIQAEFAEMLSLGPWLPPGIPKLFIQHQIHSVYCHGIMQMRGDQDFGRYVTDFTRCREVACLNCFDGVISFSEGDRDKQIIDGVVISHFVSPFPIPADVTVAESPLARFDGHYFFLGSCEHVPNCDALEWLLDRIWPRISASLPGVSLKIIGNWTDEWKIRYTHLGEGIRFAGFVPDLAQAMDGGIQLTPLRIGSGIRTKILAALARGVPNVSTSIGAEGLLIEDGEGVLIRDDEEGFAEASISLAADEALWRTLAMGGLKAVHRSYTPQAVRASRNRIYQDLVSRNSDSKS